MFLGIIDISLANRYFQDIEKFGSKFTNHLCIVVCLLVCWLYPKDFGEDLLPWKAFFFLFYPTSLSDHLFKAMLQCVFNRSNNWVPVLAPAPFSFREVTSNKLNLFACETGQFHSCSKP